MSEIRSFTVVLISHPVDGEEPHTVATWTEAFDMRQAVETILASDHIRGYDPGDFQQVVVVEGAAENVRGPIDAWWPRYDGTLCRTAACHRQVDMNAGTDYCEACTAYENQEPHA